MARYRCMDIVITVGAAAQAAITNGTLNSSVALVETTGGGDAARSRKPGYADWTMSFSGRYEGAALPAHAEGTISFAIKDPSGAGVRTFTGVGILNQATVGGDHESAVDLGLEMTCSDGIGLVETTPT